MSGRRLVLGFLAFLAVFAAALVWFQLFAYYERQTGVGALAIAGAGGARRRLRRHRRRHLAAEAPRLLPHRPRRRRRPRPGDRRRRRSTPPSGSAASPPARLTRDLAAGAATAYRIAHDQPPGFDLMLAVYPDGRGYLWRQLNAKFE